MLDTAIQCHPKVGNMPEWVTSRSTSPLFPMEHSTQVAVAMKQIFGKKILARNMEVRRGCLVMALHGVSRLPRTVPSWLLCIAS